MKTRCDGKTGQVESSAERAFTQAAVVNPSDDDGDDRLLLVLPRRLPLFLRSLYSAPRHVHFRRQPLPRRTRRPFVSARLPCGQRQLTLRSRLPRSPGAQPQPASHAHALAYCAQGRTLFPPRDCTHFCKRRRCPPRASASHRASPVHSPRVPSPVSGRDPAPRA